mgnify:CR=1 FL=1
MDRLIWQPGCRECEGVRGRLAGRSDVRLVAGLFPATPHGRHGYTVILPDGTGITGGAALQHVRRWTASGARTALTIAGLILGLWFLACAGLFVWPY